VRAAGVGPARTDLAVSAIVTALVPILGLILLGFALRRAAFLPDAAWPGIERLTYFVLFPALLVSTLGGRDLGATPWGAIVTVVVVVLAAAAGGLVLWQWRLGRLPGPTFTSVFQGGVRFNTYIALALIQAFLGPEGLLAGAVVFTFMIVLVNLLCVSAFAVWGATPIRGAGPILREIVLNPLILACVIGGLLGGTGIGVPVPLDGLLEILGSAALPLGLLAVGAALRPEEVPGHLKPALVASAFQFGLKPVLVVTLTTALGLGPAEAGALIVVFMTPTAPASYILARQLGGDTATMASIVTLQTALAFVVVPLLAWGVLDVLL
jgi:predicted permease